MSQQFEEKLKEIISRSRKIHNMTKSILEADQKVALGIKEARTNVEHYGLVFDKQSDFNKVDTTPANPLMKYFSSYENSNEEYLVISFDNIKKTQEKTVLNSNNNKNEVLQIGKVFKASLLTEGTIEVKYKEANVYETDNVDTINDIYKVLLIKEKELQTDTASKLREQLMSL